MKWITIELHFANGETMTTKINADEGAYFHRVPDDVPIVAVSIRAPDSKVSGFIPVDGSPKVRLH